MHRGRVASIAAIALAMLGVAGLVVPPLAAFARSMRASRDQAARHAAALVRHREAVLADEEAVAGLALLRPRAGGRDAGPIIAPRVGWPGADPEALARWRASIPEPLRGLALEGAEIEHLPPFDALTPDHWQGRDLSWLASLADFDHWDLDAGGPEPSGPFRGQPALHSLLGWAKLRLGKSLAERSPDRAIGEVEQLARLCASTEQVMLLAASAELLEAAGRARGVARARGLAVGPGPAPALLQALRRLSWAPRAWTALRASPAHDADWDRLAVGRCAALQDGLSAALVVRPSLGWGRRAEYERLGRLLAAAPECRLRTVRKRWARPDEPAVRFDGDWLDVLEGMGAARLRAEALLSVFELEWLEPYEAEGR